MTRHLGFFNTQPYMAGFVLGVVGRLEEDREDPARIAALKGAFAAALAGIGDAFFWGALRPLCAMSAIAAWIALWTFGFRHAVAISAGLYLLAYNAPALWTRWRGVEFGYRWGAETSVELGRFGWQRKIRAMRWTAFALAAAIAAWALVALPWAPGRTGLNLASLVAAVGARRLGYPTPRIFAGAVVLFALAASMGL